MTWEELADEWRNRATVMNCHTSGSTGTPAIISIPKSQMSASAMRTIKYFSLSESSCLHSCISPDFIGGKMMFIRSEVSGASFSWEKPSNRPFADYTGPDITLVSVVPSQLRFMLDNPDILPRIENVLVGGAPLPDDLRSRVSEMPFAVYESYGMTETASHIALRRVGFPQTSFSPLEGIAISCDNRDCLVIDIYGWKKVVTNDVARLNSDGSFEILGRVDNVIISGGIKIHPEIIEKTLSAVLSFPVMATSEKHPKWGESLMLIAETTPDNEQLIKDTCHRLLPHYHIPKKIIFGAIPRTENGKYARHLHNN